MDNLDPDTIKHLTWFVMGAIMEWVLKMDPSMLVNKNEYGFTSYDHYVCDTVDKMIKTMKAGDSRHLDGSCSDLQCVIGTEVLKRFCPKRN